MTLVTTFEVMLVAVVDVEVDVMVVVVELVDVDVAVASNKTNMIVDGTYRLASYRFHMDQRKW